MNNQKTKNPQLKLKNGLISFAMISQSRVDTGFRNTGKALTFRAKFDVKENAETIKQISDYYYACTETHLNDILKDLLQEVRKVYLSGDLRIDKLISDRYNLGIENSGDTLKISHAKYYMDGNWHSILEDSVNRWLEIQQKNKKMPFRFEVKIEESEEYDNLPKISVTSINLNLRQKADKKSLKFYDASKERFETMNQHKNNNLVVRDGNGNVLMPKETPQGYINYGADFEIFPLVQDGAIFEVNASLYYNTKSKTMTVYPTFICMHHNEVFIEADPFTDTDLGFAAPAKAEKPSGTEETFNYDDECPF